ncbi:MAG: acyltransferase family protein [Gammaproteobacteria bacterium]
MSDTALNKTNYQWVDYAKGIGILLVVYGHVARGLFNSGLVMDEAFFKRVDSVIYSFHMPLFFFHSGIFFVNSFEKRGIKGFVQTKIYTLVYPYLIWSILQWLVAYPFNGVANPAMALSDIYSILWHPYDQFLFLYSLFLIFVIYSVVYRLTHSVSITFLVSLVSYFIQDYMHTPWGILRSVPHYGVYFCSGILFVNYLKLHDKHIIVWTVIGVIIFISSQWAFLVYSSAIVAEYKKIIFLIVASLSIISVILFSQFLQKFNLSFISYIGQYTLEIYLAHVIFQSGFRILAQHIFNINAVVFHSIAGSLIGVICPIMLAIVFRKLNLTFLFYFPDKYKTGRILTQLG